MANVKDLIVNGAARVIGKLYASEFVGKLTGNVTGDVSGNATSATKLETARSLNIANSDGTNASTGVNFNGTSNVTLKLPTTIKATFSGNLSGNVTGNVSGSSGSCTGNAATATTATKLGTSNVGSNTTPIYLSAGNPTALSYTIAKSVPSDAVFTDTKVTQSAVKDSDYTNYRPLIFGSSNSGTAGFTPSTVTDGVYACTGLYVRPASGLIHATTFEGNATSSSSLDVQGTLDTKEKIDGFLETGKVKYACFSNYADIGFGSNDGMILSIPWSNVYGAQIAFDDSTSGLVKVRGKANTWGDWKTILDSSNYTTWAASKTHNHSTDSINSGTLGIERGGTGLSSFTKGDIIYASDANVLSKLAKGTDGQVLKLSNGVPIWSTDSDTKYTHPSYTAKTSGLYNITVDATGHVSAATLVTKSDITDLGIPGSDSNTTYTFATGTENGTISVTPSGGTAKNVAVKGLGSNAYSSTSYLPTSGGAMSGAITTRINTGPALILRNNENYRATVNFDSQGSEALAINFKYTPACFMINHGVDGNTWNTSGKWTGVTPSLQVKNKSVYINSLLASGVEPTYNLYVNGTSYFSNKVYIGSSSSYISYNSSTGALEFNC